MDLPVVTPENYYSPEMNMAYMGSTQFKAFEKCEAAALAELRGEYTPPTSQAFLVGGYIDAWFSGELPLYQAQHPEIFKRDGTLKAEYVKATEIVARLQADELYSMLMSGKKQVIRTGVIADVPFKVKIDSLLDTNTCNVIANRWPHTAAALGFCDGAIVDQKIMRDTAEVWSEEDHCRLPFVEAYGYDLQGAIYQAIEGHFLPFILAVGTKEDAPDLAALYINDDDLAAKLAEVEDRAPRYQAIKEGKVEPRRCEHCAYCRATKRLTAILDYRNLFSAIGVGTRSATVIIRPHLRLTLHQAIRWRGEFLHLTSILLNREQDQQEVKAAVCEPVTLTARPQNRTGRDTYNRPVAVSVPSFTFPGILTEKYFRNEADDVYRAEVQQRVLVTPKVIVLRAGDLVQKGNETPYTVRQVLDLDPYKNEYVIERSWEA